MKHTTFLSAFAAALALLCLGGCGSYNLKSIELTSSGNNLEGIGSQISFYASGNYSNNTSKDLTPRVTFTVVPTPGSTGLIDNGVAGEQGLLAPPATVQMVPGPVLTAVTPAACTWINVNTSSTGSASWAESGSYTVTATFNGVTSNPVYIAVASAAGPATGSNPGECGPTSSSQ